MVAVMMEEDLSSEVAYQNAERRCIDWGFERRRQDRQHAEFIEQLVRIRLTSSDDGAAAMVFHGQKQMSRRERMLAQHREEVLAEQRNSKRRHELAVRRRTGKTVSCRHCGNVVRGLNETKCERCKNDPYLLTARGTETRSFLPRLEAQPTIDPLSAEAKRIQAIVDDFAARERDVFEHRYLHRKSDLAAAEELRIAVAVFSGIVTGAVTKIAARLANDKR